MISVGIDVSKGKSTVCILKPYGEIHRRIFELGKRKEIPPKQSSKAEAVYELASNGISTLSSNTPSTKMLVQEAISVLRTVDSSLTSILTRMKELAKTLPEYTTVREMGGVGDVLAVKLIAEIGNVRRLHNAKALIAWAGIDPPPYESGQFVGSKRKITKRGSSTLRKVGYIRRQRYNNVLFIRSAIPPSLYPTRISKN